MDSITDIIRESKKLADSLREKDDKIIPVPTPDSFRQSLLMFLQTRMEDIRNNMSLLGIVDAELIRKVALKEMSTAELLKLRNSILATANMATATVVEPFKPTNNASGAILLPPKDEGNTNMIVNELTPEQRTALNKVDQLMALLASKIKEKKQIIEEQKIDEV